MKKTQLPRRSFSLPIPLIRNYFSFLLFSYLFLYVFSCPFTCFACPSLPSPSLFFNRFSPFFLLITHCSQDDSEARFHPGLYRMFPLQIIIVDYISDISFLFTFHPQFLLMRWISMETEICNSSLCLSAELISLSSRTLLSVHLISSQIGLTYVTSLLLPFLFRGSGYPYELPKDHPFCFLLPVSCFCFFVPLFSVCIGR